MTEPSRRDFLELLINRLPFPDLAIEGAFVINLM